MIEGWIAVRDPVSGYIGIDIIHKVPGEMTEEDHPAVEDPCVFRVGWTSADPHNVQHYDPLTIIEEIACPRHPEFRGYMTDGEWRE